MVVINSQGGIDFVDLYKTQRKSPWPTPSDGRPRIGLGRLIESMLWGGQTAHHGDDVCGRSCVGA